MLKIAICDDNIDEVTNMVSLLDEYRKHCPLKFTAFGNGLDLMAELEQGAVFDIYCLDILMPGFSGMDLAKEIRKHDFNAQIIFLTSSPEFALESYAVKATNYILKPITAEKLFPALNDVVETTEKKTAPSIVVKDSFGLHNIPLSSIVYAEAMGKKTIFNINSGRVIEGAEHFSVVCDKLMVSNQFIKPHRSYILNMNYIETIGNTEIMLQTNAVVPIARGKAKEIKEHYLAFQMEEI